MDLYDKQQQALHGTFKMQTHKELFKNYLEVVISSEGVVEYAVPSHQGKLISLVMEKNNCTREEVNEAVPTEFYCDMLEWLTQETGYIAVWNDRFYGIPNKEQTKTLRRLTAAGLYSGPCYPQPRDWFCVVTTVNDSGEVHANIVDSVIQATKPENTSCSNRGKDVYIEWFPSLAAARIAVSEAESA